MTSQSSQRDWNLPPSRSLRCSPSPSASAPTTATFSVIENVRYVRFPATSLNSSSKSGRPIRQPSRYNAAALWPSLPAQTSALMKLVRLSAPVAWVRSIAPAIRASIARSRSRFCPSSFRTTPSGSSALSRSQDHFKPESPAHLCALRRGPPGRHRVSGHGMH